MSSATTEIVHGNNTTSSVGFPEGGHKDDSVSYAAHTQQSHGVVQGGTNPPAPAAEDKRFTTAYGMIMFPTLPGLSSSSAAAPVASAGAPTKPESAGLVHQHPSSAAAAAAAPRTAQTLLPETMVEQSNNMGGGEAQFSTSSTMLLRAACDACHRMKRKCDGKHPCTRCERRSRDCFYSYKQKSGPPKGSKRKLIEEEDDLPENRPIKPTLVRHADNLGAASSVATWRRSNGINGNGEVAEGRVGGDYGTHNASSSTLMGSAAQQFSQVAVAQQYSQVPVQQSAPAPAQHCVPVSTQGFGHVSSAPIGPSPEARAAAAAAVAASRMNALAPVPPPLTATGLRPSYMLQHPPALPGLSGGSGVAGGGVPAAAPIVAHQQYGSVYQHQYPPEVYAVYLAELRQRSTGCSSTANSNTNVSNYNHNPTTAVAAATPTPAPPAVGHSWEAKPSLAAPAETAQRANPVEGGSTRTEASEAARPSQPLAGMSGAPLLPGIGGGWVGGGGGAGASSGRGGDSGGSGGVQPDTVALAHVAKMPEEGGQGDSSSGYAGKAKVAAASSEALAEAVAAAIAESSPKDGDAATENTNALTYSTVPLSGGDGSIGGGGGANSSGGGGGTLDPKAPLSPVKSNHLDFMTPRGDGSGAGTAASPKAVAAAQAASSFASGPAVASMQREKTELAAAGLLLYGARGQGGGSSNTGVENEKIREGQENSQS